MQAARTDGGSKRGAPRAPKPSIRLFGWNISSFQFFGVLGFVFAGATALALASYLGLSIPIFIGLVVAAGATFFALVLVTRAILDEERIVYYHHEIAVLTVSGFVVAALGRPVLRYLDVVILAMGVFLAFGRLGCASVGCCHGRPHGFGWRYGHEHADVGFPRAFVGVPLVPVQLIESLAVLALTLWAIFQLVVRAPPGTVLATQLAAYALLRFFLEFTRGDTLRPAWKSFSEAQWTSLLLAVVLVVAQWEGWLPSVVWQEAVVLCLVLSFIAVALLRARPNSTHRLVEPFHVREVADLLAQGGASPTLDGSADVRIFTTSLGVKLSSCVVLDGALRTEVCTLSGIVDRDAHELSRLIMRLRCKSSRDTTVKRRAGLFQLTITTDQV